ncbi:cytochrome P450 [Actinokineospora iranica]|uniref:Cytochrome P450 n=1 Tax=Actinokineospora iranica TaxID=1271860 RepID=A0A1G6ZCS3_9PSEU|nr:cytochrome P450 [Actinokineospora iranica]SDE00331.1 Cytochrome P450 [Actinokineospora iranica]
MPLAQAPPPATPVVRGLPLLGNVVDLARDPAGFFVRCYREHGPVFRFRVFRREYPVIAGVEAAVFLNGQEGRECLRSKEFWQGMVDEYGGTRMVSGEDGASHRELRDIVRRGYSREAVKGRLGELVEITDRSLDRDWAPGTRVRVVGAMQRLVTDQLGTLLTGQAPLEYVDDIRTATRHILNVLVTRQRPRIMLLDPRYKRAKARMVELAGKMIAEDDIRGPAYLVRDVLAAHRADPAVLPAADLVLSLTGPYVAGLDTVANTLASAVYAVLKHPDLLSRVRREVDAVFADRGADLDDGDLKRLPVVRGVVMEAMRLYPIAVAQMRTATRDFEFAGHRIRAGETVYLGTSVPHFQARYFPDPDRFDPDRYGKARAEHLRPGAYSPYGRGPHTCLGKSLADVQMVVTAARLFHRLDLRLDHPGYTLATRSAPTPGPAMSFGVRVAGHRC